VTVNVLCLFDGNHLEIPREVMDKEGLPKEEYRGNELDNGVFVSPEKNFYCNRHCWAEYCAD